MLFHDNNGYANAPQCYVFCTYNVRLVCFMSSYAEAYRLAASPHRLPTKLSVTVSPIHFPFRTGTRGWRLTNIWQYNYSHLCRTISTNVSFSNTTGNWQAGHCGRYSVKATGVHVWEIVVRLPPVTKGVFSPLKHPDRIWVPSSIVFNGYPGGTDAGKWSWPLTLIFTFSEPCVVIHICEKDQEDAYFS